MQPLSVEPSTSGSVPSSGDASSSGDEASDGCADPLWNGKGETPTVMDARPPPRRGAFMADARRPSTMATTSPALVSVAAATVEQQRIPSLPEASLAPVASSASCVHGPSPHSLLSPDVVPFYPSGASEGRPKFRRWATMASTTTTTTSLRRWPHQLPTSMRSASCHHGDLLRSGSRCRPRLPLPRAGLAVAARSLGEPCGLVMGSSSMLPAVLLPMGRGLRVGLARPYVCQLT
jgi:hypothetical protein